MQQHRRRPNTAPHTTQASALASPARKRRQQVSSGRLKPSRTSLADALVSERRLLYSLAD